MAKTYTNTQVTSDQIGKVRDMAKVIDMITPKETPFLSLIGTGKKAKAVDPEWERDELAAADATSAAQQAKKAEPSAITQPDILKNHTQIFEKAISVSGTSEAVEQYNIKNKLAYARVKRAREMKRDIEKRALGNYASVAASGATAGEMAGAAAWLETNVEQGTGGSDGGFSSGIVSVYTAGTLRAITETLLKSVIKKSWDEGGDPRHIFASGLNKQTISGFSGIATQYRDNRGMGQAKILGAADFYISDFGEHAIIPSRHSPETDVLAIDKDKWAIRDLRPYNAKPLGRTGDSVEEQLIRECTLQCTNEKSSGIVRDIT